MTYTVYCDGGCLTNPGPCAWGAVVLYPDTTAQEFRGFIGAGTNQVAEITAAIEGLKQTPEGATVELVSDSQYTLKGLTEWRKGWEKNGMVNSQGKIVANLQLWLQLYAVADKRKVTTRWVKGHNGDKYNERCDALAMLAVKENT